MRDVKMSSTPADVALPRRYMRFGIPSLDQLFNPDEIDLNLVGVSTAATGKSSAATSFSVIGRSGTGKSVLALHLASRYLADCFALNPGKLPKVLYVSTDLTHARAAATWKAFGLIRPNSRQSPFDGGSPWQNYNPDLALELQRILFGDSDLAQNVFIGNSTNVAFLDLATRTAGDDWGFLMRCIALLPPLTDPEAKHLLIIDAVEGLEMLTGSIDAHGQERSRRSRIAQVLRTAGSKCHIAFVLEESSLGSIPDEEFVTDVVLRLHTKDVDGYLRRTIEITKSRGGSHVRGHHDYVIRGRESGKNTPDEPTNAGLAYFYVIHSLHWLTRMRMRTLTKKGKEEQTSEADDAHYALFDTPKFPRILPNNGLPRGEVTILTGDEATYKARLGRAFLAGAFRAESNRKEVAVYLTTHNLVQQEVVTRLQSHLVRSDANVDPKRVVYRQLEAHSLDSAMLFHIIRRCVEKGLSIVRSERTEADKLENNNQWWAWEKHAGDVRLVIDDWTNIKEAYPQVAQDSLFLPFLVRYLEEKGVTTLIVETSPGRPDQIFSNDTKRNLRSLAKNHLLSWHVRFFGEDRVAFAAVPPIRDRLPSVVAELRPPPTDTLRPREIDERLWADAHFEYYTGIERGDPKPVPLEVNLFAASNGFKRYQKQVNSVFNRIFPAFFGKNDVVQGYAPEMYAAWRESSQLLGGVKAAHTVVTQVDEYWKPTSATALTDTANDRSPQDIEPYLLQPTIGGDGKPHRVTDPYQEFQPSVKESSPATGKSKRSIRHSFFKPQDYGPLWVDGVGSFSLVPYFWDFGFLLLRNDMLERALEKVEDEEGRAHVSDTIGLLSKDGAEVSWLQLLTVCQIIAKAYSDSDDTPTLDMDLLSPQTFACLVFEIWASEIEQKNALFRHERHPEGGAPGILLTELLNTYSDEFFKVWLLLSEVLKPEQILSPNGYLQTRKAPNKAVIERHWYSTAAHVWKHQGKQADARPVPVALPGRFSTRGDWFLTVGSESRSMRLGERAIDLLSRRTENVVRLEHGLGLPVRRFVDEKNEKSFFDTIRSAMTTYEDGKLVNLSYKGVMELGARDASNVGAKRLKWLWRSHIQNYHRQDRVWERWLARFMAAAAKWKMEFEQHGKTGFDAYSDPGLCLESRTNFNEMVNLLTDILERLAVRGDVSPAT